MIPRVWNSSWQRTAWETEKTARCEDCIKRVAVDVQENPQVSVRIRSVQLALSTGSLRRLNYLTLYCPYSYSCTIGIPLFETRLVSPLRQKRVKASSIQNSNDTRVENRRPSETVRLDTWFLATHKWWFHFAADCVWRGAFLPHRTYQQIKL